MDFCVDAATLRAALAEIEAAEANGFAHCLVVMRMRSVGPGLSDCVAFHPQGDLIERAHPTDPRFDWGRFQRVSARHKFINGKLVPINKD